MPINNNPMKFGCLLAAAFCAFSASPVAPQAPNQQLQSSPNFNMDCDPASVCPQSTAAAEKKVLATLEAVEAWFNSMGYRATRLSSPTTISITDQFGCAATGSTTPSAALACVKYSGITGNPTSFYVPVGAMTGNQHNLVEALAHESAHTRVRGNVSASKLRWMNEAVAEAIGFQWLAKQGGSFPKIHPFFEMDLDLPFHEGTQGGYEKAPYIDFMLGKVTAPLPDKYGNLSSMFANWPNQGQSISGHPMQMLYENQWIAGEIAFPKVFPAFVAQYNNPSEKISGVGRYYDNVLTKTLPKAVTVGTPYDVKLGIPATPFAATPVILTPGAINAGSTVKDVDRLAAVTHEIVKAPQIGDLSLIFEHKVAEKRRHSYLTFLHPGYLTDYGFIRITNAGASTAKTKQQKAELELRVDPVAIVIPPCIGLKGTTVFKMTGASPADITNFKMKASAGHFDGMTYHPPASAQEVTFQVVIESPMTRAQQGISPASRPDKKVELGKQKISNTACSVRMNLENSRKERIVATQDLVHGFTEYITPQGSGLYARRDEIIAKSKGKWSDPLPSSFFGMAFKQMPMGALGSLEGMLGSAPGGGLFGHLATIPVTVTQTFKRETVATLLGNKNMKPKLVSCPDGSGQCEQFSGPSQGHALTAIYNTQAQLVVLQLDNEKMTFEYNVTPDDIPPAWDTGPASQNQNGSGPNS